MPTDRVLIEIVTAANMAGIEQANKGMLGMNLSTLALGAALGGLILIGKAAIDNTEKQSAAHKDLQQAASASKENFDQLQSAFDTWAEANKRYIPDQYAAEQALASFVRAGASAPDAMRELSDALDLATIKGEDMGTAQLMITLALAGNARGLKTLGITTEEYNAIMKSKTLDNEQKHLALLTLIETKTKDGRKAQTDLSQSTNALNKDWQDITTKIGPPLIGIFTTVVGWVDDLVKALSDLGANKDWNKWISEGLGHVQDALLGAVHLVQLLGREGGGIGKLFGDLTQGHWTSIPGDVSALQHMDAPGVVAGPPGSRQIVAALGGERFGGAQSIGGNITININNPIGGDGPYWDKVGNMLAQRLGYATGR